MDVGRKADLSDTILRCENNRVPLGLHSARSPSLVHCCWLAAVDFQLQFYCHQGLHFLCGFDLLQILTAGTV